MGAPPFSSVLFFSLFFLFTTTTTNTIITIEASLIHISPNYLPFSLFSQKPKPSPLLKPLAFVSSVSLSPFFSRTLQTHYSPINYKQQQRDLLGIQRRASAVYGFHEREEEGNKNINNQKQQKPSFSSRFIATGFYLIPTVDALQAFAFVPVLTQIAGRLSFGCNVISMATSFLILRKKLLHASPFIKHHLMTASLLSMCSFTLANIHYKVLSFFLSKNPFFHESLGFASGASLLSLISRAACSAARGKSAALPVLSEAVALHLGPDNYSSD